MVPKWTKDFYYLLKIKIKITKKRRFGENQQIWEQNGQYFG
jgi:hypothetical protein